MIWSMTGFGKGRVQSQDLVLEVVVRTLNSKTLDLNIRLPQDFRTYEPAMRRKCTERIKRGKTEVLLNIRPIEGERKILNESLINRISEELKEINSELSSAKRTEMALFHMDAVQEIEYVNADELGDKLLQALEDALDELDGFRANEGAALDSDLRNRVKIISQLSKKVSDYESERLANVKKKLEKNLQELKSQADPFRLEQEMIYYAERFDITEEKVRLAQHCEHFLDEVNNDKMTGKKLNFIGQEMGREINTMGAKANHFELQKIVIEMKDELEKIKEQILNVL